VFGFSAGNTAQSQVHAWAGKTLMHGKYKWGVTKHVLVCDYTDFRKDYTDIADEIFNLCNLNFNQCNQGRHFCDAL